jgi:hypothetical protein
MCVYVVPHVCIEMLTAVHGADVLKKCELF